MVRRTWWLAAWLVSGGCGREFQLLIEADFSAAALAPYEAEFPLAVSSYDDEGDLLVRNVVCIYPAGGVLVSQQWTRVGKCRIPASLTLAVEKAELAGGCTEDSVVDTVSAIDPPLEQTWESTGDESCDEVDKLATFQIDFVFDGATN